MALLVTLAQLTQGAQERAHMENGAGPCSVAEWTANVNAQVRALYRVLTQAFGSDYFATSTNLVTVANVATVALPATFFKLVSLWLNNGSGTLRRIRKATEGELERQLQGQGWGSWIGRFDGEDGPKYRLRAGFFLFVPTPTAVHTVKCNFIAAPATLVNVGDTLDGYGGFEEYVMWGAAAMALAKEESDASFAMREQDAIVKDIKETAERDQSEPDVIADGTGGFWGE
jgi:hypothetical protein